MLSYNNTQYNQKRSTNPDMSAHDEDLEKPIIDERSSVQTITLESQFITINIDGPIDNPKNYRQIFQALRQATPYDFVNIVINTPGGDLDIALQLYHYLLETNAPTKAEVHTCYSAGTFLALACDEIEVARYGSMMIHSALVSTYGKMHEIADSVKFSKSQTKQMIESICFGFLTHKEIQSVLQGKDLWLSECDIREKLKTWIPIRNRNESENKEKECGKQSATTKL